MGSKHFVKSWFCEGEGVWKVTVYDSGFVTMCEYDSEKKDFVDCTFATKEEADEAGRRFNESWN